MLARNHAAIARVAALLPVNTKEADRATRAQAENVLRLLRQKHQAIDGAANEDACALHVAERSMLRVLDPDAGPVEAAWPGAGPVETLADRVDPVG